MKRAVILKEEEKVGRLFKQIQRIKIILLDSHLAVEMNKTIIIVYSTIKQDTCNNKEIQTMVDFIVLRLNINIRLRMNTINKKVVRLM